MILALTRSAAGYDVTLHLIPRQQMKPIIYD